MHTRNFVLTMLAGLILALSFQLSTAQAVQRKDAPGLKRSTAMADSPDPIPSDPAVITGQLENGIRYYIQKNEKPENRAELRLVVHAGSMQEDEDQLGVAHFVEHMAFNGSTHFSKNELVNYLESVGTRFGPDLNAYTSFDETVYMLQVRTDDAEHLDKGLLVLEDWAQGISFDDEEIDKERGVVISEWRTRLSANQRMQQEYFPVVYHQSRYADRLPIGKPEIIENAPYDVFRRFYRDWYRPDLMAVVVVGDVDTDSIEKEIRDRFGKIKPASSKRGKEGNDIPGHEETLVSIVQDREATFTQIQMMIKHPHKPVTNLAQYRASLVRNLYNRMLNARLDELTRTAEPPFIYGYSGYGTDVGDIDTYSSFAMVQEGSAVEAYETLLRENYRVLQHGFNVTELERQKDEMMNAIEKQVKEQDKTESARLASRLVYHDLRETPIPSPEQQYQLYDQMLGTISVDEVNALAKQFLKDENMVIVLTGPDKEGVSYPSEHELLETLDRIRSTNLDPYVDETVDEPLMDADLKAVPIVGEKKMEDLGIQVWTLANGIEIYVKQTDFKNDEINMNALSPGGTSLYQMDKYYSADEAASIVNESGLRNFDLNQLDRLLAGKTVRVSPFISERYEGLQGSCSPDDLETMFELAYLYFTAPRKDETAFASYIKKQKGFVENLMSNPNFWFNDQLGRIKSQNHPRRMFPTPGMYDQVMLEDALNIYSERFGDASDFTFFFVGNFDPQKLREYCATYLGNLPGSGRDEDWKDLGIRLPKGKIERTFYRGEAPKSNIHIFFHGDYAWNDWNNYVFQSMIDLMRIKLREAMREDKGGVYGVNLFGGPSKKPVEEYEITISFNSDPPRTDELIQTAFDVIEQTIEEGVTDEDLQKVKETQRQSRIKDLEENRFWMRQIQSSYLNGTDLENIKLETLEGWIKKLSAKDLQMAVGKYFNKDQMIKAVMHPERMEE